MEIIEDENAKKALWELSGAAIKAVQDVTLTAQFFQGILSMLLGDSTGIEPISPAQKDDFAEGQRLVKSTLGIVSENELNLEFQNLVLRLEDWTDRDVENLGRLIRVDKLHFIGFDAPNSVEIGEVSLYLNPQTSRCLMRYQPVKI